MKNGKTIFDLLNDMTFNKVKWSDQSDADKKSFQPYMVQRWLSMHPDYLDIVAYLQPYMSTLSAEQFYTVYLDMLPKKKFFTKYITAKKDAVTKNYEALIEFFADKWDISQSDMADRLITILKFPDWKSLIKEELNRYGINDSEIKKQFNI